MARYCPCGNVIPLNVVIEGKLRNLQNRRFCLICSPFGKHNTRDLFRENRPHSNAKFRRYQEKERRQRKDALIAALGGRCSQCGYNRCTAALEFHHRDPAHKAFELCKTNLLRPWKTVLAEAEKCDLLCANCHRELENCLRQERGEDWDGAPEDADDASAVLFDFDGTDEDVLRETFAPYYLAA